MMPVMYVVVMAVPAVIMPVVGRHLIVMVPERVVVMLGRIVPANVVAAQQMRVVDAVQQVLLAVIMFVVLF